MELKIASRTSPSTYAVLSTALPETGDFDDRRSSLPMAEELATVGPRMRDESVGGNDTGDEPDTIGADGEDTPDAGSGTNTGERESGGGHGAHTETEDRDGEETPDSVGGDDEEDDEDDDEEDED